MNTEGPQRWEFTLYVAGMTPAAKRALSNITRIGSALLTDRFTVDVVDLRLQPELAERDQIFAVPTLIRRLPPGACKLIGDLSDTQRVMRALDLEPLS